MKKLFTLFALALSCAVTLNLSSCKDTEPTKEPDVEEPELKDIELSPSSVIITVDDVLVGDDDVLYIEPIAITVTADHDWEIKSNPEWITVSDVTPTGFNITAEPYGPENVAANRRGEVVVASVKGEWSVTVTQHRHDIHPVSPFNDYLGSYHLTGELVSAGDFNNEFGMGPFWNMDHPGEIFPGETLNIVDAAIVNPNLFEPENILVAEKVLQYEYGGYWMPFAFDPETATISNIQQTLDGGSAFMVFVYRKEEINGWVCIAPGLITAKLDENDEIVLPQTVNIGGVDETVYFMPASGVDLNNPDAEVLPFSYDAIYNIKLVKNQN